MAKTLQILQSPGYILRFLLFIVLPLVCLYESKDLSFGSSLFPVVTCLIMLCVGIKQAVFFPKHIDAGEVTNFSVLLIVLTALIIFCIFLDIIGFYADIFLLSCFFYLHFETPLTWKKCIISIIVSTILTICMFLFFRYALQLVMPEGILFDALSV